MIHFESDYLDIHWDEDVKCVEMVWKKFVEGEIFRNGLHNGLALVMRKKATRLIIDTRETNTLTKEDQGWCNEEGFPRALKVGVKKIAIVSAVSEKEKSVVYKIMDNTGDTTIETEYFNTSEEAKNWIK